MVISKFPISYINVKKATRYDGFLETSIYFQIQEPTSEILHQLELRKSLDFGFFIGRNHLLIDGILNIINEWWRVELKNFLFFKGSFFLFDGRTLEIIELKPTIAVNYFLEQLKLNRKEEKHITKSGVPVRTHSYSFSSLKRNGYLYIKDNNKNEESP